MGIKCVILGQAKYCFTSAAYCIWMWTGSEHLIRASLSEPHTSVNSLRTCVCMYVCMLAWTDHLPKILNERVFLILRRSSSWLLPECSVGYLELRRLKLKHTWHLTPCLLQIINGRLPTGSTNFDHEGLSGRFRTVRAMPKRHL